MFHSYEKRAAKRFARNYPVVLLAGEQHIAGEVLDVSVGGLAIRCDAELPIGCEVCLDFSNSLDSWPVLVSARVRNRRGDVFGLQYVPRSLNECRSLDWVDGVLAASGFDVKLPVSENASDAKGTGIVLVAGLVLGAWLGQLYLHTPVSTGVGSLVGMLLSYSAVTL